MQLMFFLGNDFIDAVPVVHAQLQIPGFLGTIKRNLQHKYKHLLDQTGLEPEFIISDMPNISAGLGNKH